MKNNFYLYGFVFASLFAMLVYFNSSKGLETQERQIQKLEKQVTELKAELAKCAENKQS